MVQLICKDVILGYDNRTISKDINFEVNKGDYLSIVGENGSGKSTLVKAMLGLIRPVSGTIKSDIAKIGYLPQQTEIQKDFPASVSEVVLSGCSGEQKYSLFGKAKKQFAKSNMDKLGILSLEKRCFRELSGGQQQRVFLARALCAADDVLLLDEPTAGLDPSVTNEMYELLSDLNRNENMTIIMVSHDINAALKYSSKILHIGESQLFFGTTENYKKSDIGKAYTKIGGKENV